MTFILDGKILPLDTPFEHDGTSYPANWLRLATPEMREAIGITEQPDYPRPDDRFYWCSQNTDGTWTAIPKDLDGLKTTWAAQMRQTAYTLLLPSDWMIARKQETNVDIPVEWSAYRSDVRTTTTNAVASIESAQDVDGLIEAVSSIAWPVSPDAKPIAPTNEV